MSRRGRHPHAAAVSAVAEGKRTGAAAEWRSGATQVWMNAWGPQMNGCVTLCTRRSWPQVSGCHTSCSREDRLHCLWTNLFGSYKDLVCRLGNGFLREQMYTIIVYTIMRIWKAWLMRIFFGYHRNPFQNWMSHLLGVVISVLLCFSWNEYITVYLLV